MLCGSCELLNTGIILDYFIMKRMRLYMLLHIIRKYKCFVSLMSSWRSLSWFCSEGENDQLINFEKNYKPTNFDDSIS